MEHRNASILFIAITTTSLDSSSRNTWSTKAIVECRYLLSYKLSPHCHQMCSHIQFWKCWQNMVFCSWFHINLCFSMSALHCFVSTLCSSSETLSSCIILLYFYLFFSLIFVSRKWDFGGPLCTVLRSLHFSISPSLASCPLSSSLRLAWISQEWHSCHLPNFFLVDQRRGLW